MNSSYDCYDYRYQDRMRVAFTKGVSRVWKV
jgi:hypothetical protein